MKSLKYTIGIVGILGLVFLSSCKEDILDITPAAKNTSNDYYQNETQLNQAVIAIYNDLQGKPVSDWYMSEIRSDNSLEYFQNVQRDWNEIGNFILTAQTAQMSSTWTLCYNAIYRANILLEKIEPFSFTKVNQFKGEAKFLRALFYYDLVRYFGDLPITTKPLSFQEAKVVQRSPRTDVYNLIVEDLKFAVDNLPETYIAAEKGRATKFAAKALLGDVYLTMSGFPLKQTDKLALAKAQYADVIAKEGTGFAFAANYADMFKTTFDNKYHIFEVQYITGTGGLGNPMPFHMAFQYPSQWAIYQPGGFDGQVSPTLVNGWSNTDKRKFSTLDTGYTDTKTLYKSSRIQFTKFLEKAPAVTITTARDYANNFPIIRYEDVLLKYAEILNEEAAAPPAQAITNLNRIRTRAGLASITPITKEAFRLAIEQERQWEFCGENLRWHDLIRTGRAGEVMTKHLKDNAIPGGKQVNDNDLIYPIPQSEMLINPGFWKQNAGYN
jgi:starch-binding outer membrane protein, SusD/RagB family